MAKINLLQPGSLSDPAQVQGLRSAYSGDREEAAMELARRVQTGIVRAERAKKLLGPLLTDAISSVRLAAGAALLLIDPVGGAPPLANELRDAMRAGDPSIRRIGIAAQLLAMSSHSELLEPLRESADAAVRDASFSGRATAGAVVLGEIAAGGDGAAVRPLLALLADPKPAAREAAARALGRCSRPEAFAAVRDLLLGGDRSLVAAAIEGLAMSNGPEVVEPLREAIHASPPAQARSEALEKLERLPSRFRRRVR